MSLNVNAKPFVPRSSSPTSWTATHIPTTKEIDSNMNKIADQFGFRKTTKKSRKTTKKSRKTTKKSRKTTKKTKKSKSRKTKKSKKTGKSKKRSGRSVKRRSAKK